MKQYVQLISDTGPLKTIHLHDVTSLSHEGQLATPCDSNICIYIIYIYIYIHDIWHAKSKLKPVNTHYGITHKRKLELFKI